MKMVGRVEVPQEAFIAALTSEPAGSAGGKDAKEKPRSDCSPRFP